MIHHEDTDMLNTIFVILALDLLLVLVAQFKIARNEKFELILGTLIILLTASAFALTVIYGIISLIEAQL